MDVNLKIKIYLEADKEKFMGIGVLWLLQSLEQEKSLRSAALRMGVSYSKAYTMVSNLEKALGKQVVRRRHGGYERSGAVLTDYGKKFIKLYDSFQMRCKELLEEPFDNFRKKLEKLENTGA